MLEYWLLIKRRFQRPLRQMVLIVGRTSGGAGDFEEDGLRFHYEVIELRKIDAEEFIRSGNHGDLALAVLAGGGDRRIREILERAAAVKGPARDRLLLQVLILSGLRGISGKVEWELKQMPVRIDIDDIPVIGDAYRKGRAEGEAEGMSEVLREQIQTKFGPLPKWAQARMAKGSRAQFARWARKVLVADTLEAVIGPRQPNGA